MLITLHLVVKHGSANFVSLFFLVFLLSVCLILIICCLLFWVVEMSNTKKKSKFAKRQTTLVNKQQHFQLSNGRSAPKILLEFCWLNKRHFKCSLNKNSCQHIFYISSLRLLACNKNKTITNLMPESTNKCYFLNNVL